MNVARTIFNTGLPKISLPRIHRDNNILRLYWSFFRHKICSQDRGAQYFTRLARSKDHEAVMCVMYDTYLKFEPSIVNLGLPGRDLSVLDQIIRKGMKEGMTIVAVRQNDERVVGAAINTGSCPWDPRNLVCLADRCQCESIQNLLKFYAHVTASPDLWEKYCVPKIFECTYVSVLNECQGQGLAKRLIRDSWFLARDCGYRLFRIDCTSRYTAKIAESFGWKCVWSIPYQKYMADGKQVFQHIQAPHTIVDVYVDQIRFCKDYCRPYAVCKKRKKKITTPEI